MHALTIHHLTDFVAYWVLFWTVIHFLLPPKEVFARKDGSIPEWYIRLLLIIQYYGSLNIRQVTMQLYGVSSQQPQHGGNGAAPTPPSPSQDATPTK